MSGGVAGAASEAVRPGSLRRAAATRTGRSCNPADDIGRLALQPGWQRPVDPTVRLTTWPANLSGRLVPQTIAPAGRLARQRYGLRSAQLAALPFRGRLGRQSTIQPRMRSLTDGARPDQWHASRSMECSPTDSNQPSRRNAPRLAVTGPTDDAQSGRRYAPPSAAGKPDRRYAPLSGGAHFRSGAPAAAGESGAVRSALFRSVPTGRTPSMRTVRGFRWAVFNRKRPGFQGFRGRDPDGLRIRLRQRTGGSGIRRRSGSPRLQPLPEGVRGGLFIKR